MKSQYTTSYKQSLIARYHNGESVLRLSKDAGIPRSTLYYWLKTIAPLPAEHCSSLTLKEIAVLQRREAKQENIIKILKTVKCTAASPLRDKLYELEALYGQFTVYELCEALDVPRGTFYNHLLRNKKSDAWYVKRREELRVQVLEVFDESRQLFGAGKIRAVLLQRGVHVSEAYVSELMREMGIYSVRTTSKKDYLKQFDKGRKRNMLQRQFHAEKPNIAWVSDVTCFKFNNKYFYICVILDLFSRKVIACRISKKNSTQLVASTFREAWASRTSNGKLLFHSDRGRTYMAASFRKLLYDNGVSQSFSNSGKPYDNAVMESFFSSLKKEELYRTRFKSEAELKQSVFGYIAFYNEKRPHHTLNYKTPNEMEKSA